MQRKVSQQISKSGWCSIHVFDLAVHYTYSIGLMKARNQPDLVILGMDAENAHGLMALAHDAYANGSRFALKERSSLLTPAPFQVGLTRVPDSAKEELFGQGVVYYGGLDAFDIWQVLLPDRNNLLPWDEGVDPNFRDGQDIKRQLGGKRA